MSTLFISDLDGTLLNQNAELSKESINILNTLYKEGAHITCATARTIASVKPILSDIQLSTPIILMNGAAIYDLSDNHYIKIESIPYSAWDYIFYLQAKYNAGLFTYQIKEDQLTTFYKNLNSPMMEQFYIERITKYRKRFENINSFDYLIKEHLMYCLFLDHRQVLQPIYEELSSLKETLNIDLTYYKDIYFEDGWCLEIFSTNASKYNAALYIKNKYHFDKLIGFGDNLNDLSLFQACNQCYAVKNAADAVKLAANEVIDTNISSSVAKKIYELYHR